MATILGSSSDDFILPTAGGNTYNGIGGNDTYILSSLIPAGAAITIRDTSGTNRIQLVDGLTIASSTFYATFAQLTLSNGAVIDVNGANNFIWDLGMFAGIDNTGTADQTYAQFAAALGATVPASDLDPPSEGDPNVVIGEEPPPSVPTFTLSGPSGVSEGGTATYTVTLSEAQAAADRKSVV